VMTYALVMNARAMEKHQQKLQLKAVHPRAKYLRSRAIAAQREADRAASATNAAYLAVKAIQGEVEHLEQRMLEAHRLDRELPNGPDHGKLDALHDSAEVAVKTHNVQVDQQAVVEAKATHWQRASKFVNKLHVVGLNRLQQAKTFASWVLSKLNCGLKPSPMEQHPQVQPNSPNL
jgi:hypothetical protein